MKDKMAYKQSLSAENLRQATSEVRVTKITQEYCESLESSLPRRIQAVIDSNAVTLKLLDVIKIQTCFWWNKRM